MEQLQTRQGSRGFSAATLKWIAIITMLIDHVGASLLYGHAVYPAGWLGGTRYGWGEGIWSRDFYMALRVIGRLAFPIFCFLLIEGLIHTRNRWKYFSRLALFALISEIPFDLAFKRTWWNLNNQNVFFTLALGLGAAAAWDWLTEGKSPNCRPLRALAAILTAAAAALAAMWLKSDYGALGVVLILVMYLLRDHPWARDLLAFAVLVMMVLLEHSHWIEVFGALSFPLMHLYNNQRGRQNKYFFYLFYPVHLLLLSGLLSLIIRMGM